ncbi:hypothetical protein PC128_g23792 [Phytophthora cactorum]|nr:hypothetical protein PC128_g23792 [Phytophthora cactorum]
MKRIGGVDWWRRVGLAGQAELSTLRGGEGGGEVVKRVSSETGFVERKVGFVFENFAAGQSMESYVRICLALKKEECPWISKFWQFGPPNWKVWLPWGPASAST